MKNISIILTLLLVLFSSFSIRAQDVGGKTLISQSRTTIANIGKCDITIKYHSPSVNGRKIFGGIVPYNFVVDGIEYPWRAGSNQRTIIEFSHDVIIEGRYLAAGVYGFLILVDKEEWTLIFSSGKSWGAFNYKKENDVLRVPVKTNKMPHQEWLSYAFINPKTEAVDIQLWWEKTAIKFNIQTDATTNLLSDLAAKDTLYANDYQNFAAWTLEKDSSNLELAIEYLEESLIKAKEEPKEVMQKAYAFYGNVLKADLLIQKGHIKNGKRLKEETLKSARGFDIYYYALRKYTVEGKKEEAFKLLNDAIELEPDNFQNHFAFGEYYLKTNDQVNATKHFKTAYKMTLAQKSKWVNYARYLFLQNKLVLENLH